MLSTLPCTLPDTPEVHIKKYLKKSVRFSPHLETVGFTYSSIDYDRSRFAIYPPTTLCAFRPPTISNQCKSTTVCSIPLSISPNKRPHVTPLDLSMVPNSSRRTLPYETTPSIKKTQRPKLFVDTKSVTDPLFFTSLSTNYKCRSAFPDSDNEEEEESEKGYLAPMAVVHHTTMLVIG
ncbi:hypothetical protein BDF14DRAFT_1743608 [Spinellus fusiger]|nr:hypothetical protein BDF14DRAFT_1743608 [Spinellus fusiger]